MLSKNALPGIIHGQEGCLPNSKNMTVDELRAGQHSLSALTVMFFELGRQPSCSRTMPGDALLDSILRSIMDGTLLLVFAANVGVH